MKPLENYTLKKCSYSYAVKPVENLRYLEVTKDNISDIAERIVNHFDIITHGCFSLNLGFGTENRWFSFFNSQNEEILKYRIKPSTVMVFQCDLEKNTVLNFRTFDSAKFSCEFDDLSRTDEF